MAFNKMFVVLPVMLAARRIDGDDPNIVYWLRVAYGTIQTICALITVYTYIQASAVAASTAARSVIYVPPAPTVRIIYMDQVQQLLGTLLACCRKVTKLPGFTVGGGHSADTWLHPQHLRVWYTASEVIHAKLSDVAATNSPPLFVLLSLLVSFVRSTTSSHLRLLGPKKSTPKLISVLTC